MPLYESLSLILGSGKKFPEPSPLKVFDGITGFALYKLKKLALLSNSTNPLIKDQQLAHMILTISYHFYKI